jgi:hypothetical protein
MAETIDFEVQGQVLQAVRETQDWFVYSPEAGKYVGKVLIRPHSPKGPYIAYLERKEVSDNHPDLESAVESIAFWLSTNAEQ